jgi:Tfp pilus assembly protein PilF
MTRPAATASPASSQKSTTPSMSREGYDQLVSWALSLYESARYMEALNFLRGAHQSFPEDIPGTKLLAACYHKIGYKREAAGLYRKALKLEPKQPDVMVNLGEILIAQLRYDEALDLLKAAIDMDQSYMNPNAQRARALIMQVIQNLEE